MSVYELGINAEVKGADKVQALGSSLDALADKTKKVDDWTRQYEGSSEKLKGKIIDLQREEAKLEGIREQHRMLLAKLAADAEASAQRQINASKRVVAETDKNNQALASSVKNWIQNPLSAAGSAAEQFILKFGGMGVAAVSFGSALAAGGAIALKAANDTGQYAQEVSNLALRTGMTTTQTQLFGRAAEVVGVNAGSLTTAMRTLSRGLAENSEEGKKQKEVLQQLGFGLEAAYRPMGELLPDIFEKLSLVGSAMERDRMTIALFGRGGLELEPLMGHFKQLEEQVTATGVVLDEKAIAKLKEYKESMTLLGMEWDAVRQKLGMSAAVVIRAFVEQINGGPADIDKMQYDASPGAAYNRRTRRPQMYGDGYEPTMRGGLDPYLGAYGALTGPITVGGNTAPRDPAQVMRERIAANEATNQSILKSKSEDGGLGEAKAALATAQEKLKTGDASKDESQLQKDVRAAQNKVDGIEAQNKALKAQVSLQEHLAELDKRSNEMYAKSLQDGDPSSAVRKYQDARIGIDASQADDTRKAMGKPGGMSGADLARINSDYSTQMTAADIAFMKDLDQEIQKQAEEGAKIEESIAKYPKILEEGLKKSLKDNEEMVKGGFGGIVSPLSIGASPGPSAAEQMALARNSLEANLRQAHIEGSSPEGRRHPAVELNAVNAAQKAGDKAEYEAKLRENADTLRGDAKAHDLEAANIAALTMLKQKDHDADMAREEAMEALREKDAEKYATMAGGLFDAIHGHTMNAWGRSYVTGQAKQVFENLAGPQLQDVGHIMGGAIPNIGPLGTALKGTMFDSANAGPDALPVVTKSNTDATLANSVKIDANTNALERHLATIPGSATYNPAAQAADVSNYQAATGADGMPNASGQSLQQQASFMASASSPLALAAGSTAALGAIGQQILKGGSTSSLSALSMLKSVPGIGKLISAILPGSSSASSASLLPMTFGSLSPVTLGADAMPNAYGTSLTQQAMMMPSSTGAPFTVGSGISAAATMATSTMALIQGLNQGGVGGNLKAAGGALGDAVSMASSIAKIAGAALPAMLPVVGSLVAAVLPLVGSFFTSGPTQRAQQITDDMAKNAYLAPTALNVTQGMNGTYEDFDARGNLRTSSMSAVPTVAQPYITTRTLNGQQSWYDAPGVVQAPYSGGATGSGIAPVAGGTTVIVQGGIQAMDSSSFHEFLQKPGNSMAVGESLATHLQSHEGRASNAIRFVAGA